MIGGLTGCEQQQRGGDAVPNGGPNAWRSDVPSAARDPYAIGSQFLRADELKGIGGAGRLPGGTGDAIDTTPKLSSLWTPGPWSNAVDSAANSGSNISVLRSLRMGGSACSTTNVPSSTSEAGNIVAKGLESNTRPGENTEVSTNSFLPAGSEDVMNYLSIFN